MHNRHSLKIFGEWKTKEYRIHASDLCITSEYLIFCDSEKKRWAEGERWEEVKREKVVVREEVNE